MRTMRIWALTHLIVERPIIAGVAIVLVVIGFVLSVWLEDRKR
jgi:hypothetical protein